MMATTKASCSEIHQMFLALAQGACSRARMKDTARFLGQPTRNAANVVSGPDSTPPFPPLLCVCWSTSLLAGESLLHVLIRIFFYSI